MFWGKVSSRNVYATIIEALIILKFVSNMGPVNEGTPRSQRVSVHCPKLTQLFTYDNEFVVCLVRSVLLNQATCGINSILYKRKVGR